MCCNDGQYEVFEIVLDKSDYPHNENMLIYCFLIDHHQNINHIFRYVSTLWHTTCPKNCTMKIARMSL